MLWLKNNCTPNHIMNIHIRNSTRKPLSIIRYTYKFMYVNTGYKKKRYSQEDFFRLLKF